MKTVSAVLVKVGQEPEVIQVNHNGDGIRELVGGWIESTPLNTMETGLVVFCDEEGKLKDRPFNFEMIHDYIVGDAVIVAPHGENFGEMTPRQIDMAIKMVQLGRVQS